MHFTNQRAVLSSILQLFQACIQRLQLQAVFLGDYGSVTLTGYLGGVSALQDYGSLVQAPVFQNGSMEST